MNVFNALLQSASLLPASSRLISPHTVARSLFDTLSPETLRTKGEVTDSMGGFIREGNQQVPLRVLPTFLHIMYHIICFLQHTGAC